RLRLGEQPLSPPAAETADRPAALAAVPRRHRTPAGPGPASSARPHPEHSRQPQGNRTGGTTPGAGDDAAGRVGLREAGGWRLEAGGWTGSFRDTAGQVFRPAFQLQALLSTFIVQPSSLERFYRLSSPMLDSPPSRCARLLSCSISLNGPPPTKSPPRSIPCCLTGCSSTKAR